MEVLVINPGSTSTKIAIYQDENPIYTESISHTPADLAPFPGVLDQLEYRLEMIRAALDKAGFPNVKISVSGGFTPEKIKMFIDRKVPVDSFGVGSCLFEGNYDYTADIVMVNGKPMAKAGRTYSPNPRLNKITI